MKALAAGLVVRFHWLIWRPGKLAKNTLVFTAGLAVRALLQALLFIAVARSLGPEGYGEFIAISAMMTIFTPLVGLGASVLLVRDVARNPMEFPVLFGRSLVMIGMTAIPLVLIAFGLACTFLPEEISRLAIVEIALAETLFVPLADIAARAYQASERLGRMAMISTVMVIFRVLGFGVMMAIMGQITPQIWASYYLAFTIIATLVSGGLVSIELGQPHWRFSGYWLALREGLYFAMVGSVARIHAEIDKTMLARLDSLHMAGAYSAAYRFTDLLTLPIAAFLEASAARFFRSGEGGIVQTRQLALKLMPVPLAYAISASISLYLIADFVPWLLGTGYTEVVMIVQWLAVMPVFFLIRYGLRITLATGECQRLALLSDVTGAGINVILNLWLIPVYGWYGAVITTFLAEGSMLLMLFVMVSRNRDIYERDL